ncbi:MAG: bifunctional 5,10-methylenetetrahydrofolate dehydrogenase/5,10-methenyltetrahydrofolate cyclohydrolase [Bacillota bacterium]
MAEIINCSAFAERKLEEVKDRLKGLGLAIVSIGDDSASKIYMRNKIALCEKYGVRCFCIDKPGVDYHQMIEEVSSLNEHTQLDGVMIQLPTNVYFEKELINTIAQSKDVDCLTYDNLGKVYTRDFYDIAPCTATGIVELLCQETELAGKNVTIIGRSQLVGLPLFKMLTNRNCTVTLCHSYTKNLGQHTKNADIVISAVGKQKLITADMVSQGQIVIGVGINRTENGVCGDVDFEKVAPIVKKITTVPNGIGKLTTAYLLLNLLKLKERTKQK